jgi:predicted nuclease of restriction endonuclease-like RecB superfamily
MLTGKHLRVRFARHRIVPNYLDAKDPMWLEVAERLIGLFLGQEGRTRGELEAEVRDVIGESPTQLVHHGLAKLLEDRCDFEVVSGHPPEQLRELVFQAATAARLESLASTEGQEPAAVALAAVSFDRQSVLERVAALLATTPEAVDQGLFADLKSEQRLTRFKDTTPERLLQRYNVALVQAVLLRSTRVHVTIRGEPPQRYRQLLRLIKFHRLVCEIEPAGKDGYHFHLDGPLSLFTSTHKYGLQLALFTPAILRCRDFELRSELSWGPQRRPKILTLTPDDGLVWDHPDSGMYTPPELAMFVELFRKKVEGWDITNETDIIPLGDGFWVPDFRLTERASGRSVYLEVLGFWRRGSAERHLERLRCHAKVPFLLAVSDQLRIDEADLDGLPAGIHRFRQMPLPDEVGRLAEALLAQATNLSDRPATQ